MNNMQDRRFDDKIRSLVQKAYRKPPEDSWANIDYQLDIQEVWQGVDARLNQIDRFRSIRRRGYIAAAAAAMLILLFIPWPANRQYNYISQQQPFINKEKKSPITQKEKNQTATNDKQPASKIPKNAKRRKDISLNKMDNRKVAGNLADAKNSDDIPLIAKAQFHEKQPEGLIAEISPRDFGGFPPLALKRGAPKVSSGTQNAFAQRLHFGLNGSLSNTWLLNNKTYAGFEPQKLVSTQANYEHSFAVATGMQLNSKWQLQAEFAYQQNIGQTYFEFLNGDYVRREINLHYTHGAALLRYGKPAKPLAGLQARTVWEGGVYYNYLRTAKERLEKHTSNVTGQYRNTDLGLMIGVAEELALNDYISISAGLRANYGLWNVFEGTAYLPEYLNNTKIASFNVILGLQVRPFH